MYWYEEKRRFMPRLDGVQLPMLILIWSFPIWVNMYLKIDEDIKLMFRNGDRLFVQVVTFYLELLFVLKGCCWV